MWHSRVKYYDGRCTYKITTSTYTMSLERKSINSFQMPCRGYVLITYLLLLRCPSFCNGPSPRCHVGLKLCKRRLKKISKQRVTDNLPPEDIIPDRMINEFLRQCPYCQLTNQLRVPIKAHRFTCASYNPFEVLHTVILYVLFYLTYMYCTLYILHILYSPCSLFPCFWCWGFIFNICSRTCSHL